MNKTMKAEDAKKIISTAIDREVESYTFYKGVADKVKDANLKKLFAELAGEEKTAPRVPPGDVNEGCIEDEI